MNGFCLGFHSDRGSAHEINQDSFFVKSFFDTNKRVMVAGLFDGMGGHSEGERASGAAAQSFSTWVQINKGLLLSENVQRISVSVTQELDRLNDQIRAYGAKTGVEMGTTAALLILWADRFLCCNVGDSRVYHISKEQCVQISQDHSLVAELIKAGLLDNTRVKDFPQRNVLTQALGVLEKITPSFSEGSYMENDVFGVFSDGFYHEISEAELREFYSLQGRRQAITNRLISFTEKVIARGETDNITGIIIKTINEG